MFIINSKEQTAEDQLALMKANISQALLEEKYNNIMSFILNNSKLNYDKSRLTIDYGELVLEYIKAIEPTLYKTRHNELIQEKQEENN